MAAALDQPAVEMLPGGLDANGASITPPNSANGKKDAPDGVPSELSDLELDPNSNAAAPAPGPPPMDEEVVPDHYYGGGNIPVFKPVSPRPALELREISNTSALCCLSELHWHGPCVEYDPADLEPNSVVKHRPWSNSAISNGSSIRSTSTA